MAVGIVGVATHYIRYGPKKVEDDQDVKSPEMSPAPVAGAIERYTFRERATHWLTGLTYLYCLATGLAFYSPHFYWLATVLGGGPTSRFWHPILGVVFLMGTLWMQNLWRRDMELTVEQDKRWLDRVEISSRIVTNCSPYKSVSTPAKSCSIGSCFTVRFRRCVGFFMWISEYAAEAGRLGQAAMILIHEIAALLTIGGFIIHVYMGVFFVPDSMHGDYHRLGAPSMGEDASSLVHR